MKHSSRWIRKVTHRAPPCFTMVCSRAHWGGKLRDLLMHMLCANTVRLFPPKDFSVLLFALTTALVIAAVSVSYHIIAVPLVQLGRCLSKRRPHDAKLVS